jgi:leucyl-tRNA synthetase
MAELNFRKTEKKWQKKWEQQKIFEPEINKREKFFCNFPYPYINAYQHIGHMFTLMRVEAFARYKRLRGFNVLFPQGWHVTGSPIVNAAKRVKDKEPKQIKIMKNMGIKSTEIKKFEKPEHWVEFFAPEFKKDYQSLGMSIDWRREFHTSSLNPHYDKFIQWQFRKLKEKGYCIKGKFPVVWDPKDKVAVGDHDRIEGEGEVPQEFYLFKFSLEDKRKIITATLRHDTIWGITNIYVNPDVEYLEIETRGENWIVGKPIIDKLKNQRFEIKIKGKVKGEQLIGKKADSFGNKKILVLPADFLDTNYGTGMVHSVPSDSADDLIALRDLQNNEKLIKKYNLNLQEVRSIEPIEIFETPGIGGNSAQYFLDKYNVKSQNERDKLEKIKKELYKLTFTTAKLGPLYKKGFSKSLEGMKIPQAQEIIKKELLEQGKIEIFYELTGKVISRSLTECVVKIVDDQWFLNYADPEWKQKTHECLKQLKLYPKKARQQFEYVIDWLHEWACTREEGLGTKLPWDEKWLIESLSDSTIYMAYYTIAHLIKDIPIDEIDDKFFDYVFLGKGKGNKKVDKLKKEFEYWYPVDFRNSGKDLIQNHLTFFMFNHTAIFPKKHWPKGIGANGWVTVDGQKMSKSLGNMVPVRDVVKKYGADASRFTILSGGEGMDDPNWDSRLAESLPSKFLQAYQTITENYGKGRKEKKDTDKLIESKSNRLIKEITEYMDEAMFRSATQKILFDYWKIIKEYINKEDKINKTLFEEISKNFLIMLNPFCPHITEEIWEKIKGKGLVSLGNWPKYDEKKINEQLEKQEEQVEKLAEDINNVIRIVEGKGKKISKGFVYCIPPEKQIYEQGKKTVEIKTQLKLDVYAVNDKKKYDPENKAKKARPGKPAIYLE